MLLKKLIYLAMAVANLSSCGNSTSSSTSLFAEDTSPMGVWEQTLRGKTEEITIQQQSSNWFVKVPNKGTLSTDFNLIVDATTTPKHMTFTVTSVAATGSLYAEFRKGDVYRCNYRVDNIGNIPWLFRQCASANSSTFPSNGAWKGYKKK